MCRASMLPMSRCSHREATSASALLHMVTGPVRSSARADCSQAGVKAAPGLLTQARTGALTCILLVTGCSDQRGLGAEEGKALTLVLTDVEGSTELWEVRSSSLVISAVIALWCPVMTCKLAHLHACTLAPEGAACLILHSKKHANPGGKLCWCMDAGL